MADKNKILLVKFDGSNHYLWEFHFWNFLEGKEMWSFIDRSITAPVDPKEQSNEGQCYTYQLGFDFCWSTFFPFLYILAQQSIKCGHTYVKVIIKGMMQGDFNLNLKTKNINKVTNPSMAIIPDLWHLGLDIAPWHILLIQPLLSLPSKVFMSQHSDINLLWKFGKNRNLFKQV